MIPNSATALVIPLLDWFRVDLAHYPIHLLACLILWALMVWLLPVNRVSAWVFVFSAWFAVLWVLPVGAIAYDEWERVRSADFIALSLFATPALLFGWCAVSSAAAFGAADDPEADGVRFVRWAWFWMPAMFIHFLVLAGVES